MVEKANWTLTVRASDDLRHFGGETIGVWLNRNPVGSVEELVFQESVLPANEADRQRAIDAAADFANAYRAGHMASGDGREIRVIMAVIASDAPKVRNLNAEEELRAGLRIAGRTDEEVERNIRNLRSQHGLPDAGLIDAPDYDHAETVRGILDVAMRDRLRGADTAQLIGRAISMGGFPDFEHATYERDQFLELRDRLKATDFLYHLSDDWLAREEGKTAVETSEIIFRNFASHSRTHAELASFAWDEASNGYKKPESFQSDETDKYYIQRSDRAMDVDQYNILVEGSGGMQHTQSLERIRDLMNLSAHEWTNETGRNFAAAVETVGGRRLREAVGPFDLIEDMEALVNLGDGEPFSRAGFSEREWLGVADRYYQVTYHRSPSISEEVLPIIRARQIGLDIASAEQNEKNNMANSSDAIGEVVDFDMDGHREGRETAMEEDIRVADLFEDVQRALELAAYTVADPSAKKMYLDPVTSYAIANGGKGYKREITLFLPYSGLSNAGSGGQMNIYSAVRQLKERGFGDPDIPESEWGFDNEGNAEHDGAFSAYLIDESDNALVVHFRELERGMDMPDIREQNVGPVEGIHKAPLLTGTGILQHVTRGIRSMVIDVDYMAASYMTIHRHYSDPDSTAFKNRYDPIQVSGIQTDWKRDMDSSHAMATFLKVDPLGRSELERVIQDNYAPSAGMKSVFRDAETYAEEHLTPFYDKYRMEINKQEQTKSEPISHVAGPSI